MIAELNGDFLQWLRGFYYTATTGSVRTAAKMMNRNPSTISYQLKSLEEELGTLLFDRRNKSLRITDAGKNLLAWTISTFATLEEMRSAIGNRAGEFHGPVRVAATLPILALAVNSIGEFVKKHSKIQLNIERGLSNEVRDAVHDGRVDFGILPVIFSPTIENFEIFMAARPMLITPKSNPWNISAKPDFEELKRLPFVSFMETEGLDELGIYMSSAGLGDFVQRNSVVRVNNYHLILRFVRQGLGAAIMDEFCFLASRFGADWDTLEAIDLSHILPVRKYGMLTRAKRRFGLQTIALMEHLREFFTSLAGAGANMVWSSMRQLDGNNLKSDNAPNQS